ncbi:MAG TPA: hypothetical protein VNS88_16660 [Nitrospiraceae bacterium]|nr:hypothetical protein [Nitrospiraceae bacterium]
MNTAPSSEKLAQELEKVGLADMAKKARENYYHDFFSETDAPAFALAEDLAEAVHAAQDKDSRDAIKALRDRHLSGEFDATLEESKIWTDSDEAKEAFGKLLKRQV